jgi:hypothetical protein
MPNSANGSDATTMGSSDTMDSDATNNTIAVATATRYAKGAKGELG